VERRRRVRARRLTGRQIAAVHGAHHDQRQVIAPEPGYLETVRRICQHCAVLVFDETIALGRAGGAAERYGVYPDLVYGKPPPDAARIAGRRDLLMWPLEQ
jgi:glutamate-1-semialdehyde aminotransferase